MAALCYLVPRLRRCLASRLTPSSTALHALFPCIFVAWQDFSPCELFQRIRGRTLWFMGDSQTWNLFYAAECFLREFAPSLVRT